MIQTPTLAQLLKHAIESRLLDMHTALITKVESYDAEKQLVNVSPVLKHPCKSMDSESRLKDANNETLSIESRFDLAYNEAHSLALAALRLRGYRSTNRYLVFQTLPHTTGLGPEVWRVLAKCHERRNLAEYEGSIEIEEQLMNDLLSATKMLLTKIETFLANSKRQ